VGGAAGAPATLAAAELAFNEQDNTLYYGKGNSSGVATSVVAIAGSGYLQNYVLKSGDTMTGALAISNTTASSSPTTGALTVAGGLGVSGGVNGAGIITSNTQLSVNDGVHVTNLNPNYGGIGPAVQVVTNYPLLLVTSNLERMRIAASGDVNINSTTASSGSTTGALTIGGGLGVGGSINAASSINATGGLTGANLTLPTGNAGIELGLPGTSNTPFIDFHSGATVNDFDVRLIATGGTSAAGHGQLQISADIVALQGTTPSTSPTTGVLTVPGGAGVSGQLSLGGPLSFSAISGVLTSYCIARPTGGTNALCFSGGSNGYIWNNTANSVAIMTLNDVGALNLLATVTATGYTASQPAGGYANTTYTVAGAKTWLAGAWPDGTFLIYNSTDAKAAVVCNPNGDVNIPSGTASSSPSTGALTVQGGLGVNGQITSGAEVSGHDLRTNRGDGTGVVWFGPASAHYLYLGGDSVLQYIGGQFKVVDTTPSSGPTTGALTIGGGLGVTGNIYSGANIFASGNILAGNGTNDGVYYFGNVANSKYLQYYNASATYYLTGAPLNITNTASSSSSTTGALIVGGGLGVTGNINGGGGLTYTVATGGISNFNSASVPGFYEVAPGQPNAPESGQWYLLTVQRHSNLAGGNYYTVQHATQMTNSIPVAYMRTQTAGTWGAWRQVLTTPFDNPISIGSPLPNASSIMVRLGTSNSVAIGYRNSQDGSNFPCAFYNSADTLVGYIQATATATSFSTSSDGRLKTDLKPFDAGPILDAIRVYDFAWIANPDERSHGVVAQEVAEIYPEAVTRNESSDIWGTDYSRYVPLLLQEIKALRARVATLESAK
jgi:Chaperone of endosialidase